MAWIKGADQNPDVTSFSTIALWDLMYMVSDRAVLSRWTDVQDAYEYLAKHPQVHRTACRLIIDSDWGEIGLLTPGAFIEPVPGTSYDPTTTSLTRTKVYFRTNRAVLAYTIE